MEDPRTISLLSELLAEFKKLSELLERVVASNPQTAVSVVKIHKKSLRKINKSKGPDTAAGEGWIPEYKALIKLGVVRTTLWRHRKLDLIRKWKKQGGQVYYWDEELTALRPKYIK